MAERGGEAGGHAAAFSSSRDCFRIDQAECRKTTARIAPAIRSGQREAVIRHARQLGFDLVSIRSLLDLSDHPDRPCAEANVIAERHLAEVKQKIAQLRVLKGELSRMTAECAGGRVSACKVIEALHDHSASL
jgi:hypothetical protein